MELFSVYLVTVFSAALAGGLAFVLWRRGLQWLVVAAWLAVVGLAALFWYLASIATGAFLAGLGETIVALWLALAFVPGIALGAALALSRPLGLGLSIAYALGLAVYFVTMA